MKKTRHASDIQHLLNASKALSTMAAWQTHGLFEALQEGPRPLSELDGELRALEIAAPVLVHVGLLATNGARYGLTPSARALLASSDMPSAQTLDTLRDLSRMADVLRDGGPVHGDDGVSKVTTGGVVPHDQTRTRRFLSMLYRMSAESAQETFDWLRSRLFEGAHVLDLGGGHGRYARVFADHGYAATLLDFPLVVDLARERHGDHLRYREGDFLAGAELGGPYDMALLSNIVHGQSDAENGQLIARVQGSLAPGGWLVLKDMFIDEQGSDPENGIFFGLTMLYYTQKGRSYSLRDVTRWCADAGFGPIEVVTLQQNLLVMAQKA